ncbi:MAG: helix-turn-helix transcriptional regulator [Cyanobacteria bacterium P01_F01_bin.86]
MTVIIKLKQARDEKGLSLNDLARVSGLSPQYLSKLENGGGNPSLKAINAICKGLEMKDGVVSWIEYIDDENKKEPEPQATEA